MTRYALYFAPHPDSAWWKAGCQWVGRDPASGEEYAQPAIADLPHRLLPKLTSDARRYGFHATLKAPFRLENGFSETHLLTMARAFCATQPPIEVPPLAVGRLGASLALLPEGPCAEIDALALRCTRYFDRLRAAQAEEERKKYRDKKLSARQDRLLRRWGYPYTEDEFRFHLTLTDSLHEVPPETVESLSGLARTHFAKAQANERLRIDDLTIFREDQPGSPFVAWQRFKFNEHATEVAVPRKGRLFYCIGGAGTGHDALLAWVREHLPFNGDIVFAQRTISRPVHDSELHEPVDETTFLQLEQDGYFAMHWRANGLCYGIRRNIEVELAVGRDVIVNGAPEYLPQLYKDFPDALVIRLDPNEDAAGEPIVAAATRSRNRRVAPAHGGHPDGLDFSGPVQAVGQRLLDLLAQRE